MLALSWPTRASHLMGGEISYRYVDAQGPASAPYRYELTALLYINQDFGSAIPMGRPAITFFIYDRATNLVLLTPTAPRVRLTEATGPFGNCSGTAAPLVGQATYTCLVELPFSARGYRAETTETARNAGITNLVSSGQSSLTLSTDMAPPTLPNFSPIFSDTAVAVVCRGDTAVLLNNAYDADGDRLSYAFGMPSATYAPGYTVALPFGRGGYAHIDANTGLSRYLIPQQGRYVVAVDVSEYRTVNGTEVLLGSMRRDIQLVSRNCPSNQPPAFTAPTLAVRSFTITEGDPISFNVAATDPDGQRLTMRVASALLDGAGPFDASFNNSPGTVPAGSAIGSVSLSGTGSVSGTFRFNSRCGATRTVVYDVVVTVTDDACATKSVAEIFRITVNRAAPPSGIRGDSVVCAGNPGVYTALGPAPAYRWTVRGGQIQGPATGRSVQVLWGPGPLGSISARPASTCPADSATRSITIVPSSFVTLGPVPVICPGASVELTASGAQTYSWTGGGRSGSGPRFAVAPTQTTTYLLHARNGNCTSSQYVTVTVNPLVISGPTVFCPEARSGLSYRVSSFPGLQYQWSISGGTISAGQGSSSVQVDLLPGSTTATLQVATSNGCSATLTLQADNARPLLEAASVLPAGNDRRVALALRVPGAAASTGQLSVYRRPAGSGSFQLLGTTRNTELAFTDSDVDADAQAYDYRLELRNGCGTLLSSQEHTTILTRAVAVQQPEGRREGRAEISWTGYQGFAVQAYRVFRQVDGGPAELLATLPATARRLEISTSNLGFAQCFRVQAQSADADLAAFSNEACVPVENKLAFYNIITPNGDGQNDAFIIDNVTRYPGNTLSIFNRWGRQVYQARDYDNSFTGATASPGLYYYLFRLPDGTNYKGWLEIVR
ncbi:hypothetical protein GCM10023185_22600 [Hymenobacter saemangeumensis]|uniref:PKD-like domain-containing protein n=2 Tax=Hymenobacter saemangeumensis TaxID=1084522 RepID=A0ABP8IG01_9BACT